MEVNEFFSYRNFDKYYWDWIKPLEESLKQIPDDIFFESNGSPLKREVKNLDQKLFKLLIKNFGEGVEKDFAPMAPKNQFTVDFTLPTKPLTLTEIEKGKLPRLELDLMKIINSIFRYPLLYGFGCLIVPNNYIQLNLAGKRSPYQYIRNNLIPLNSPILDRKNEDGSFLIKDIIVLGYFDPRGK
ncbi:MAG: hypothetical protein JW787_06465 [Sedimentisphaerales bacterium]|nr:hypothetical protein [Sedimentisphaerales bacterium]